MVAMKGSDPLRTLILSDVHGNLPALEAVLASPEARTCDAVISLGDHVSFCAQSREVHDRLVGLGAAMLLGNHEERLLHPEDAQFDGYNWAPMRWTAEQMRGTDMHLPVDLRLGPVLCTHGVPGDPYQLVYPHALPELLDSLPEDVTLLLSGHNHMRWDVSRNGKRAFNPGSVGLAEDSTGCTAPFAVLDGDHLARHTVSYDVGATLRAFITSGMCSIAPEICRACARVLLTGEAQGVTKLMRHVSTYARNHGLDFADQAAWEQADRTYCWTEPVDSRKYWKLLEEKLC